MSVIDSEDHTTEKDRKEEPLLKVRWLVDAMQTICMHLGQPHQHVSLDERMVGESQGTLQF